MSEFPAQHGPIVQTTVPDPAKPVKAVVGALLAGLGATATALLPDSAGVVSIELVEWVGIAIATLAAGGAVYGVTNPQVPRSGETKTVGG